MVSYKVVLVRPQNDGNVGAVARSMGNFGFKDLVMVDPAHSPTRLSSGPSTPTTS